MTLYWLAVLGVLVSAAALGWMTTAFYWRRRYLAELQNWRDYIEAQAKVWLADQEKLRRYETALFEANAAGRSFVLNEADGQARLDRIESVTREALYPGGSDLSLKPVPPASSTRMSVLRLTPCRSARRASSSQSSGRFAVLAGGLENEGGES